MLEQISIKFDDGSGEKYLDIPLTSMTVFVGPNNSGKSLLLREIEKECTGTGGPCLLLKNACLKKYSMEELEAEFATWHIAEEHGGLKFKKVNAYGECRSFYSSWVSGANKEFVAERLVNSDGDYKGYISAHLMRLDGTNRLSLLDRKDVGDLKKEPINSLAYLLKHNKEREQLRHIVHGGIGYYLYLDPTNGGNIQVRLSHKNSDIKGIERSLEEEAIDFFRQASPIEEMSDGVKAFCGIVASLIGGNSRIVLIDEPEAFLHPSLAHRLGNEVGTLLRNQDKVFIGSTHSPDFLMGCIESKQELNIIRLTYRDGLSTARILDSGKITKLMRNPLLRSTGVLNALFYENVIVCEADTDRAFYQEVNARLLAEDDPRGIKNCLFINAQNKQTVWDIVSPLRDLGIPAVGIVDIDVLKEGGTVFKKLTDGVKIPSLQHESLAGMRHSIHKKFQELDDTGKKMKRNGGIHSLPKEHAEACENFFDQLGNYGAFVVSGGELEIWFKKLGITGHGPEWLIAMFEKMGEDPASKDYLRPKDGDVWEFIGQIKKWIDNPSRSGIPEAQGKLYNALEESV